MKILNLSIITSLGIAALVILASIIFLSHSASADGSLHIAIDKHEYGVGEPVTFFVDVRSQPQDMAYPVAYIVNDQNQIVWYDDDLPPNGSVEGMNDYRVSEDSGNVPMINETGEYSLFVTYKGQKAYDALTVTKLVTEDGMMHFYGPYEGIDKDTGTVQIANQTYYVMTVHGAPSDQIHPLDNTVEFHGVYFKFPGCGMCPTYPMPFNPPKELQIQFPDNTVEKLQVRDNIWSTVGMPVDFHEYFPNGTKVFPNGTRGTWHDISHHDQIVTTLTQHTGPQAGITVTHDAVKFLVSSGLQGMQSAPSQNASADKNATLVVNFNSPQFDGYQGLSFLPSHDGSMYAYSTPTGDPKSGNLKVSLWLYFLKNETRRSLYLNSDPFQMFDMSFSPDDKKILFVGNGCDGNTSHAAFYILNLSYMNLKCNDLANVRRADWMPGGSVVVLQNNEKNDTVSIYHDGAYRLLYAKQIAPQGISLNSSHIEFIKASPDGKKIALWYFVFMRHVTQILDVDTGKIADTLDGGHPRWSQDGHLLLYTNPISTGYYHDGPRKVVTYINLLDVDNNKTTTIDSVPVGVDDLFLSADGSKAFYVVQMPPPYKFLNFTPGIYEIDLNHHASGQKQNLVSTVYPLGPDFGLPSPLKQFKSGTLAKDITCQVGLYLIVKASDGSPACVTMETGKELAKRGWASMSGTVISVNYLAACDTPILPKPGIAVLYMPVNSIGELCLKYNYHSDRLGRIPAPSFFEAGNNLQRDKNITIWNYSDINTMPSGNITIDYWIKTGNQSGFYGISFPSCIATPFAVGYGESAISAKDFPFLNYMTSCDPDTPYIMIDGTTGIGIKYIQHP